MPADAFARLLRSPEADAADRAAIRAEAVRRRDEARRAHAALRWSWPPEDEPSRPSMTRRDAWVVVALVLLSAAVSVWIGWALAAHVAERVQEAGAAAGRLP